MVLTTLLPLAATPLTGTGKINRRELHGVAAGLAREEINSYLPSAEKTQATFKRPPGNEVEQKLHSICAQVPNIDPNEIGMDDDFFRLGGDSISAMQVAAKVNAVGLVLTVTDIVAHKSIEEIASCNIRAALMVMGGNDSEITAPFSLSPIQSLFFDTILTRSTKITPISTRVSLSVYLRRLGSRTWMLLCEL